jgi:hypothetical protein
MKRKTEQKVLDNNKKIKLENNEEDNEEEEETKEIISLPITTKTGKIRVGRTTTKGNKRIDPKFKGFTPILVLTKSSPYGSIGPYVLKNEHGQIMENIWQFSRLYSKVPKSKQFYSRYDRTITWDWKEEIHSTKEEDKIIIKEEYWNWRKSGYNNQYPIRYPVGFHNKGRSIIGAVYDPKVKNNEGKIENVKILNYIESRKMIYIPVYGELVRKEKQFKQLKERLKNGK